jgi:tRNA-dihydrouridine synthase
MDGVTDASFRYITAKHGGPDVIFTEFVNIQAAFHAAHTLIKDLTYCEIERPVVAQIYGRSPELFYKVAHIVCELGFDGLDINMGCPARKVAAAGCGAGARSRSGYYQSGQGRHPRLVRRTNAE